ncbi:MAG TPA: CDC27 family protein, partial [Flavobacterium sp.]|nr:CDC27 family protein [Flavobacterium sp.]
MHKFTKWVSGICLMATISVTAQQSEIYSNESADYNRAIFLYKNNQYQSAQLLFERVAQETDSHEIKADCAYYAANCAIRLEQPDADSRMERFVQEYPTSSKQNQAFIEVAHYYFEQGRYPQSLEWFDRVDESNLTARERDKFNFQKGYAFFTAKKKKEATEYFNKVVNSQEYGSQAKYYLGFMSYEADDYKEASKYFDEVSGEEKYKEKLSYFEADMNFKLGKFNEAIASGEKAMAKSNAIEKSELNKIIGESYFNLKQYDKAIPYLKEYKGKKGKWSNTDYYQLGYAYYKQNDFENAVSQFNKIIGGNDFVAQNAYYHLGESYLKLNQKQQALNAFKNASEMAFDAKIQEDAMLNYAKLSYDIGNSYQPVPDVLAGFIAKYPNSPAR